MLLSLFAADGSRAIDSGGPAGRRIPARGSRANLPSANLLTTVSRDRKGAAAVEFALVVPAMMGLLFGTFEYGVAFFSYATAQAAVRDVTRQVAVNTLPIGSAESAIRSRLPNWARSGATVSITQSSPANPATNVYTAVVSMPMSVATPLQFFTKVTNQTLRTELRMKQEMPYVAIQ